MPPEKTTDSQSSLPLTALALYRSDVLSTAVRRHSGMFRIREGHIQAIGWLWNRESSNVRAAYARRADFLRKTAELIMGFPNETGSNARRDTLRKEEAKQHLKNAWRLRMQQKHDIYARSSRRNPFVVSSDPANAPSMIPRVLPREPRSLLKDTAAGLDSSLVLPKVESGVDTVPWFSREISTVAESSKQGSIRNQACMQPSIYTTPTFLESSGPTSSGITTEGLDSWPIFSQETQGTRISSQDKPVDLSSCPEFVMEWFLDNESPLSTNNVYFQNQTLEDLTSIRAGQPATSIEDTAKAAFSEFPVRAQPVDDFDLESFIRETERRSRC